MALNANPRVQYRPTSTKVVGNTNFISLFDYTAQEAPDAHDQIAHIYGNQSVTGMLHILGNESSFASDKIIWTEEGRLHTVYNDVSLAAGATANVFTKVGHVFRKYETVHISDGSNKRRGVISAVDDTAGTFTVGAYKSAGFAALSRTNLTVFVDGSEHKKGSKGVEGSLESDFTILDNKPIILRDSYEVNGSDATQIGWVTTSNGGKLWYMQSEKDTRRRWEDRLETSLTLGERAQAGSGVERMGLQGTEGLFEAIETRGNSFQGLVSDIADIDTIVKRFDAQGKIQDYMIYVDRDQSLEIDNLLGTLNAGYADGISYGMFNNKPEMAANLGFKGYTRGTYNMFKGNWKLLNDPTLLGAVAAAAGKIRAVYIPVGQKEVYDGEYNGTGGGEKMTTSYLQSKYRVAGAENRKYKTWVTGSVGGVYTDDRDAMTVHHLSERALCVTGATNFMIAKGT